MDTKAGTKTTPGWGYNELRTLKMELELFDKFKQDFGVSGATIANADHPDAGNARIGTPGDRAHTPVQGITSVLQQFNAFADNSDPQLVQQKVAILNTWLTDRGLPSIPTYNETLAEGNRDRILQDFEPGDFPGVLLPERDDGIVTGP